MLLQTQYWLLFNLSSSWLSSRSLLCASPLTVRSSFSVMILSFSHSSPPASFLPAPKSFGSHHTCLQGTIRGASPKTCDRSQGSEPQTPPCQLAPLAWTSTQPSGSAMLGGEVLMCPCSSLWAVDWDQTSGLIPPWVSHCTDGANIQQVCVIFSNSRNVRKMALLLMSSSRLWWW